MIKMILDTDTYNEVDDQFALVYALLSPESVKVEAVHAAPFHNENSSGPGDGMRKSYAEILRLMAFMDREVPLPAALPVVHVCYWEAEAYAAALTEFFSDPIPGILDKGSLVTLEPFEVLQEDERTRSVALDWERNWRAAMCCSSCTPITGSLPTA